MFYFSVVNAVTFVDMSTRQTVLDSWLVCAFGLSTYFFLSLSFSSLFFVTMWSGEYYFLFPLYLSSGKITSLPFFFFSLVRVFLGLFSFLGWHQMSRGIRPQFGRTVSILFMVVSASQFHWLFYAGRSLPNIFAFSIGKDIPFSLFFFFFF